MGVGSGLSFVIFSATRSQKPRMYSSQYQEIRTKMVSVSATDSKRDFGQIPPRQVQAMTMKPKYPSNKRMIVSSMNPPNVAKCRGNDRRKYVVPMSDSPQVQLNDPPQSTAVRTESKRLAKYILVHSPSVSVSRVKRLLVETEFTAGRRSNSGRSVMKKKSRCLRISAERRYAIVPSFHLNLECGIHSSTFGYGS